MDILEQVRAQLKELDHIRADQQKKTGERDAILKQLQEMGYKTVDEAREALKKLEVQRGEVSAELSALSMEMDKIITQATK